MSAQAHIVTFLLCSTLLVSFKDGQRVKFFFFPNRNTIDAHLHSKKTVFFGGDPEDLLKHSSLLRKEISHHLRNSSQQLKNLSEQLGDHFLKHQTVLGN